MQFNYRVVEKQTNKQQANKQLSTEERTFIVFHDDVKTKLIIWDTLKIQSKWNKLQLVLILEFWLKNHKYG